MASHGLDGNPNQGTSCVRCVSLCTTQLPISHLLQVIHSEDRPCVSTHLCSDSNGTDPTLGFVALSASTVSPAFTPTVMRETSVGAPLGVQVSLPSVPAVRFKWESLHSMAPDTIAWMEANSSSVASFPLNVQQHQRHNTPAATPGL